MQRKEHIKLSTLLPLLNKLSEIYPDMQVGTDGEDTLSLYGITEEELHEVFPENPLPDFRIGSYCISKEITIGLLPQELMEEEEDDE